MNNNQFNATEAAYDLFDSMRYYFPSIADKVVYYHEEGFLLLLVETFDNRVYIYDEIGNGIRQIHYDADNMTEEDFRYEFGWRLRRVMGYKVVMQNDLADMIGLSQSRISDYLRGARTPSFYIADKIAKALGCSVETFLYTYNRSQYW